MVNHTGSIMIHQDLWVILENHFIFVQKSQSYATSHLQAHPDARHYMLCRVLHKSHCGTFTTNETFNMYILVHIG
jgi:hypothetical protein